MVHTLHAFMALAERIIPSKPVFEALGCVCIRDGFIKATDLQTFIRKPIAADGSFMIPAKLLKKVLLSKPKHITLKNGDDDKTELCYDKQKLLFPTMGIDEYPAFPAESFEHVAMWQPKVLQQLFQQCSFASNDTLRPALNGIYIVQDTDLSSAATTGHVLQWINDLDPDKSCDLKKPFEALVPAEPIKHICNKIFSRVYVFCSPSFVRLELSSNTEVLIRLINEEFVDFKAVLPTEFATELVLDKTELLVHIKQLKAVSALIGSRLLITVNNGHILFALSGIDSGISYESEMSITDNTVSLSACFDLALFEKIINAISEETVTWHFNDPDQASIFSGNTHTQNLLMQVRMEKVYETRDH